MLVFGEPNLDRDKGDSKNKLIGGEIKTGEQMNKNTAKRLEEMAQSLYKFRELEATEQEWLYPMLSKGAQSTLELLDVINGRRMTYEEIGIELGMNPQTVTQKLNALIAGGYPIDLNDRGAVAYTGRPRKLAKGERGRPLQRQEDM